MPILAAVKGYLAPAQRQPEHRASPKGRLDNDRGGMVFRSFAAWQALSSTFQVSGAWGQRQSLEMREDAQTRQQAPPEGAPG